MLATNYRTKLTDLISVTEAYWQAAIARNNQEMFDRIKKRKTYINSAYIAEFKAPPAALQLTSTNTREFNCK